MEGPRYYYRGREFAPIAVNRYRYPYGYRYERFPIGYRIPLAFIVGTYIIVDWAAYDLAPPPYGYQWIRVGPDMLLVERATGRIVDAVYGAYVEYDGG
jgi:Ni/Co efflux regulator RcnB